VGNLASIVLRQPTAQIFGEPAVKVLPIGFALKDVNVTELHHSHDWLAES
jgi:hypothetical protein